MSDDRRSASARFRAASFAPPSSADRPAAPRALQNIHLTPLQSHIARVIGATAFRRAREPAWGTEMIAAPDGYIMETERGRIFLDADVGLGAVRLSQISAERRGTGLGSDALDALRTYAESNGLGVRVYKVTNQHFFQRFDWLVADGAHGDAYYSTFGDPKAGERKAVAAAMAAHMRKSF